MITNKTISSEHVNYCIQRKQQYHCSGPFFKRIVPARATSLQSLPVTFKCVIDPLNLDLSLPQRSSIHRNIRLSIPSYFDGDSDDDKAHTKTGIHFSFNAIVHTGTCGGFLLPPPQIGFNRQRPPLSRPRCPTPHTCHTTDVHPHIPTHLLPRPEDSHQSSTDE